MQDLLGLVSSPGPTGGELTVSDAMPLTVSAVAGGAYEGAERFSNELMTWNPSRGSADADILPDKDLVDARSRDSARNDAYVKSGINQHKDTIVGSHFRLNSKPNTAILGLDDTWAEEFQEEVEAKFTAWAESPRNWVDSGRRMTLTDHVRLAVGVQMMAGEVFAVCDWLDDEKDRPFFTAMQMIDGDRVADPPIVYPRNDRLRGGILHNTRGRALGYFIRKRHPLDPYTHTIEDNQFEYITAETEWGRPKVLHIYEMFRPEQSRGISHMVAALKELHMTKHFRDVMLQNAVVNATYAASIESELPSEAVFAQMGGGDKDMTKAINNYASAYMANVAQYMGSNRSAYLNGVKIPHFFPGTRLQLRPATQGGPLGTEFEASLLRYIAANLDLSYEQLSRDYSGINYSTLKGSLNETHKGMQSRKKSTADRYATNVFLLWLEEAFAKREITSLPRRAPNFWDGLNREAYGACEWIGGSKGQIDELKETQAAVLRLKNNLSTDEDELARLGKDWRTVYKQKAREKKMRASLGIENDADLAEQNMMNAASGTPREQGDGEKDAE